MKKSRFSDELIVQILSSDTGVTTVPDFYAGSGLCDRFCSKMSVMAGLPMKP